MTTWKFTGDGRKQFGGRMRPLSWYCCSWLKLGDTTLQLIRVEKSFHHLYFHADKDLYRKVNKRSLLIKRIIQLIRAKKSFHHLYFHADKDLYRKVNKRSLLIKRIKLNRNIKVAICQLNLKDRTGGGGGITLLRSRSKPLALLYTILTEKGTLSYSFN